MHTAYSSDVRFVVERAKRRRGYAAASLQP